MHKLPHGHSPFTLLSHFKSQPPVKASIFLPFLYWDIIHRCSTGAASYFQQRKRASCKRSLSGSSSSIHPVHACRRGMAASSLVRGWMVGLRFPPVPARALTLSHTYCLNSDDEVFLFLHAMDMDGAVSRFSTIVACARWCYPATRISSPAIFCGV